METLNVFSGQIRVGSLSINSRRQFSFEYSRKWLGSPEAFQISISLPMQVCTNIYKDLSQKLAMKIGGENRPEWIMERQWHRFAEEIKISKATLRKRLTEFCFKLIKAIDTTHSNFIIRHQGDSLVDDVIATIKKRVGKTLQQFE
ncbi:MAG: HipA N-terminal domain-containing protein [Deltaproteobacteria bacterium]|uniref:HipA N-terminal domain-containing protein n=1 Tax=Desulfobacula sp. TaxID=2593537 RepID=UPI0019BA4770|nr:HipA N-terminal domain-containing protein [Candidatus Desulfobacula maris]MBL6995249.1 HipA N-terminal domain-containing protein [Desulfobacula sp.]